MKKHIVLISMLTVLFIAGCTDQGKGTVAAPTAEAATPTPVAGEVTPTKAATATPKPTSTPRPTNTPKPTATVAPTKAPVDKNAASSVTRIEIVTDDGRGIETREDWRTATLTVSNYDAKQKKYVSEEPLTCQYKGRGNSTWNYPKKPFNIKFDEKVSLLGMKKGKRYSFIANWLDRSAMRNYVTYSIANEFTAFNYGNEEIKKKNYTNTGWKWSPNSDFAEVYVNGQYAGLYLVTESIKIAGNRLELVEQNEAGTVKTGDLGLLFEISIDEYNWRTEEYIDRMINSKGFIPYNVKAPDYWEDLTDKDREYIQDYISDVEDIIFAEPSKTAWKKIDQTIDVTSFADYWIVQALSSNGEMEHPKSIYMYKNNDDPKLSEPDSDENGGKLFAGPVWDFDWDTFDDDSMRNEYPTNVFYFGALFKYEEFRTLVKERWALIKPILEKDIPDLITDKADFIEKAVGNDDALYPWRRRIANNVNYDSLYSFSSSIKKLKTYLKTRVEVIDKEISKL